jgi:hypothetical protein
LPSEAQIKQVVVEEISDAGTKAGEVAEGEEWAEEDFSQRHSCRFIGLLSVECSPLGVGVKVVRR